MNTNPKRIDKIVFYSAVTSLLLCSPVYSQQSINDSGLNENSLAMRLMRSTLSNNPNSKFAKISCAKVMLKNGNIKDAEEILLKLLKEDPLNSKANMLLNEVNDALISASTPKLNITAGNDEKEIINSENLTATKENNSKDTVANPAKDDSVNVIINEEKDDKEEKGNNYFSNKSKEEPDNDFQKKETSALLLTKEEILKRAKEKAQKRYANEISLKKAKQKEKTKSQNVVPDLKKDIQKEKPIAIIEPVIENTTSNYSNSSKTINSLDEKRREESLPDTSNSEETNNITSKESNKNQHSQEEIDESYVFEPYIANSIKNENSFISEPKQQQESENSLKNDETKITNPSLENFIDATNKSFNINLDEALAKVENNLLDEAETFLNKAAVIAVLAKDSKKIYDVQLSRAVLYLYKCDFEKYGKHIMSLRKGISDNVYQELSEIYKTGNNLKNYNDKLKYSAEIAQTSGHYQVAKALLEKMTYRDKDAEDMLQKAIEKTIKLDGEYYLVKGSYMSALYYFEKNGDDIEKGRTYLAIAKSLEEIGDYSEAKIAEAFGKSTLINSIENDPNNAKANLYLALFFLDKGNKNQAKEAIRRGLSSHCENELINKKLLNLSENL